MTISSAVNEVFAIVRLKVKINEPKGAFKIPDASLILKRGEFVQQ